MLFGLRAVGRAIYGVLGLAVLGFALVSGLAFAAGPAAARSYPTRPITFVVPFPPGGGNNALARMVAEKMSKSLGQQVSRYVRQLPSPRSPSRSLFSQARRNSSQRPDGPRPRPSQAPADDLCR